MYDMHADKSLVLDPVLAGGLWVSAMSAYVDHLQTWAAAGAAWQGEVSRFAEQRLRQNCSTWHELLSARDLARILQAQQAWNARATKDYTEEATQLARLAACVTLTGATPEAQETSRLLE